MLGCECKPFSDLSPFARALCVWKGAFLWCGVFLGLVIGTVLCCIWFFLLVWGMFEA